MNDDPSKIVDAIKIAKKTKAKAVTNIVVALVVKLAIMVLATLAKNLYRHKFGEVL